MTACLIHSHHDFSYPYRCKSCFVRNVLHMCLTLVTIIRIPKDSSVTGKLEPILSDKSFILFLYTCVINFLYAQRGIWLTNLRACIYKKFQLLLPRIFISTYKYTVSLFPNVHANSKIFVGLSFINVHNPGWTLTQ